MLEELTAKRIPKHKSTAGKFTFLALAAAGSLVAAWLVSKAAQRQPKLPAGIPYVKFDDGDDSYKRYLVDTRTVATAGFKKYAAVILVRSRLSWTLTIPSAKVHQR